MVLRLTGVLFPIRFSRMPPKQMSPAILRKTDEINLSWRPVAGGRSQHLGGIREAPAFWAQEFGEAFAEFRARANPFVTPKFQVVMRFEALQHVRDRMSKAAQQRRMHFHKKCGSMALQQTTRAL